MKRYILFMVLSLNVGCAKLIEVDTPYTAISSENVYNNDATAISAVTGIYVKLVNEELLSNQLNATSLLAGLSADELTLHPIVNDDRLLNYYTNALTGASIGGSNFWTTSYTQIYRINAAIEGLSKANEITPLVKQQLLGEVKFLRAFFYFYLVNLFGDVPLALTTDYTVNELLTRSPVEQVYDQIILDLKDAQDLFGDQYLDASLLNISSERVRPTKWAATALLARVYLHNSQWVEAEQEASKIINQTEKFQIVALDNAFLANSKEAIWQLQPNNLGWNTQDAKIFIIPSTGFDTYTHPAYLNNRLMNVFESNDRRKDEWIGIYKDETGELNVTYYYPAKYKSATLNAPLTEYSVVFRLAEQFLIRAEARAYQGKTAGAIEDLNVIRQRAGLSATSAATETTILDAVLHERQVELFTEWGFRWFDLKRTGKIDEVMGAITPEKGGTWNTNWQLYPVPAFEIQTDPNLTQNSGY